MQGCGVSCTEDSPRKRGVLSHGCRQGLSCINAKVRHAGMRALLYGGFASNATSVAPTKNESIVAFEGWDDSCLWRLG